MRLAPITCNYSESKQVVELRVELYVVHWFPSERIVYLYTLGGGGRMSLSEASSTSETLIHGSVHSRSKQRFLNQLKI
jgi:hypothetical protein